MSVSVGFSGRLRASGAGGTLVGMLESGARVGGWTLDWRLGGGAGGEVFRARHDDGRVAAIKLARPGTAARLAREAEVLAALEHDAFPRFVERVDGGYVMELITGR